MIARFALPLALLLSSLACGPGLAAFRLATIGMATGGWVTLRADAAELDEVLEPIRREHSLPALAGAVLTRDGRLAQGAVGVRKLGDPTAVTVDDQFHLGSCTKAMTATLVARLVEQRKLTWYTTIAEGLPDLAEAMRPEYRAVTLSELLAHRGGLPPAEASWPSGKTFADMLALPGPPRQQRLAYVGMMLAQPPAAPPGEYRYSNAGYSVAAAIAETATDTPWEALIEKQVFRPLEMTSAGFGAMGTPGKVDQPWQHAVVEGRAMLIAPGPQSDNPPVIAPAGRVHCSLADWARFAVDQLAGARGEGMLLRSGSYRKLQTPPRGGDYALGWQALEREWGGGGVLYHSGSNNMSFAVCWLAPEKGFAVLVATNQGGATAATAVDQAAFQLIQWHLKRQPR